MVHNTTTPHIVTHNTSSTTMSDTTKPLSDREALAFRQIPTMIFSTASNPLTAPLPPDPSATTPPLRAAARFAVPGKAIITGGAGSLGLTVARALLEHGLTSLSLLDLPSTFTTSAAALTQLTTDFPHAQIRTYTVDVTSPPSVDETITTAATAMGGIDYLCCFAGIVCSVPSATTTPSQFTQLLDVNLTGSFLCAQAAARHMIAQGTGGSIVFTASISAYATNFPQPQVAYNVSKAGVVHMARNLAAEWAVHGIRVNSVSPGYMDTVLNEGEGLRPLREIWAQRCPMGRMGDVEEITGPFVLLCSPRAGRYITGMDLVVDGGAMTL
ncbi:oxidoreductase, short chain dehydrogenase/reductase family [Aspergillus saccharolyticus JOP 1030-1]|uniref:NAD(P)-binding protein n=1 Tax=Aspergillus saccharolyticus JOP 1030-1 TaxID=1450539 RepID=A0A318ZJT6_9EURO|nr:NAD(P)-binding protein [Aspergillus saccharolyticus JOP 1030-1]PYH44030.1 NAD(P)-binding protein [Aspergillus saccharolyticus JOP 1030-1]